MTSRLNIKYPCLICNSSVRKNQKAALCTGCQKWCHVKCGVSIADFESDNDWTCRKCIFNELPFFDFCEPELPSQPDDVDVNIPFVTCNSNKGHQESGKAKRHLLADYADSEGDYVYLLEEEEEENCTVRGINKFPDGVFTKEQRLNGALAVDFVVAIYLCGVIGYVCSIYFVPSLEILCERLGLQPDVAGATFMAAGSSAPELFSAVIGTFISNDDTGLSAIVGSAAFNIFIIICLCCFFAGQEVQLNWWPFCRDCFVYVISILMMVAVIYDSKIYWWEGLILSLGYVVYIAIMYFNRYLSKRADEWMERRKARKLDEESDSTKLIAEHNVDTYGTIDETSSKSTLPLSNGQATEYDKLLPSTEDGSERPVKNGLVLHDYERQDPQDSPTHHTHAEASSVFKPPSSWFFRVLWFLGLPAVVLTFLTVPDCRRPGIWKRMYFLTFALSTAWLAGTSYILYWMIVVIGYTLDIPDTVMGISLLAGGTSVPDAIASVLVAQDGYGDMALSNIIGSNIFEVFVCLGFLWFIHAVFIAPVEIASNALTFTTIALLLTVAFILIAIHVNGWKLDLKMGVICLCVYAVFITIATVWELGLIGGIALPNYCPGPE